MSGPDSPPRVSRHIVRHGAGLSIALVVLAAVELALRAAGWPPLTPPARFINEEADRAHAGIDYVPDDALFWRLPPSRTIVGGAYRINALGLRGPEVARPRPPHVFRVAVVGDSCTFGLGLDLPDTFGALLETLGGPRGETVEVVRVAAPGYSSLQSLTLARRTLPGLGADATVAWIGAFNDAAPACGASDARLAAGTRRPALAVLRHLALFRALGLIVRGAPPPCPPTSPGAPARVTLREMRDNLGALVRLARRLSSRVVVLVPPVVAGTRAVPYAAAVRAFPGAIDPGLGRRGATRHFQADQIHPNRAGSVAVARALIAPLGLTGALDSRRVDDALRADEALVALDAGDATRALAILGPLLPHAADRPRLLAAHVDALVASGRIEEAGARASAALERHPGFTELRRLLAEVLAARGNHPGAIRELRAALSRDPGWIAGHVALVRVLFATGQEDAARRALERALDLAPTSPELRALAQQNE